jgi:Fic family protein
MNRDEFLNSPSGRLVSTLDKCFAFIPNPLPPPKLDLARLAIPLAKAMHAVGELSGIGRSIPNVDLLVRPFSRAEAVASSKIEGTVTSTPELLMLELDQDAVGASSDTREVNNYNRALRRGLERINHLPLSKRLLNELHEILLHGVALDRGARFIPGELRKDQNWIGARTIQNARFVPPPPTEVMNLIDDFEKFANRENEDIPILIKLALMHYQFETIHPYPDGNGRIGRLIVPLVLCEQNAMSQPLLYLSSYFEKHYKEYIDYMFDVSKSGTWEQWIEFFLEAVIVSANNAIKKVHALQDLRSKYMDRVRSARASSLLAKLVDDLFFVPATTVPHTKRELNISYNSAKNNLNKLVELQIISTDDANRRPQWFFAWEIVGIARLDEV